MNLEMLYLIVSVLFTTAFGITAFLFITSGNIKNFKKYFTKPYLPLILAGGRVVSSKADLEEHLEQLESRLKEKVLKIQESKTHVDDAKKSIEKLNVTQVEVKKYYLKLKNEIKKTEHDCKELQEQIDDFRVRRTELEDEMKKNQIYYKCLLEAVKNQKLEEDDDPKELSSSGSNGSLLVH